MNKRCTATSTLSSMVAMVSPPANGPCMSLVLEHIFASLFSNKTRAFSLFVFFFFDVVAEGVSMRTLTQTRLQCIPIGTIVVTTTSNAIKC